MIEIQTAECVELKKVLIMIMTVLDVPHTTSSSPPPPNEG